MSEWFSRQVRSELDPLRFAAGESCRGLTQADVSESDGLQCVEFRLDLRDCVEDFGRLVYGHVKDFCDCLSFESDV